MHKKFLMTSASLASLITLGSTFLGGGVYYSAYGSNKPGHDQFKAMGEASSHVRMAGRPAAAPPPSAPTPQPPKK